jgi:iron(III) transport system permease protein
VVVRVPGSRLLGLQAFSALVGLVFAAPLVYLVVRGLQGDALDVIVSEETLGPLARSIALALAVSASAGVVGTGAAWLVTRTDVPARRLWQVLLPLPLVIPSFIGAFALLAAFAPGGLLDAALSPLGVGSLPEVRGFVGAFTVLTLLTFPYVYLPAAARLRQLPPELEEAARLLGRTPRAAFLQVVLPQMRGVIAGGCLLVFLYVLSDFGAVQLLGYDTLTRAIYSNRLLDPAAALALSLELAVLAVAAVVLERAAMRGTRIDTRRGMRPLQLQLRRRGLATALLGLLVLLSLVVPVAVLVFWAIRGIVRGSAGTGTLATDLGDLAEPILNTTVVSVAAAVCAVAVVTPVAYLTVRHGSRLGAATNAVVVATFALPGLVIALALVFWTLEAPGPIAGLYQTLTLLLLAYVLHFGGLSLRTAQDAVAGVPRSLHEAAQSLRSGRIRRFTAVELPLMAPGLLAAGGLVLLSTMKELPATLLLAPAGFQTLATKIWTATEDAFIADASIAAIVLIVLSGLLAWILVVRRSAAFEPRGHE